MLVAAIAGSASLTDYISLIILRNCLMPHTFATSKSEDKFTDIFKASNRRRQHPMSSARAEFNQDCWRPMTSAEIAQASGALRFLAVRSGRTFTNFLPNENARKGCARDDGIGLSIGLPVLVR